MRSSFAALGILSLLIISCADESDEPLGDESLANASSSQSGGMPTAGQPSQPGNAPVAVPATTTPATSAPATTVPAPTTPSTPASSSGAGGAGGSPTAVPTESPTAPVDTSAGGAGGAGPVAGAGGAGGGELGAGGATAPSGGAAGESAGGGGDAPVSAGGAGGASSGEGMDDVCATALFCDDFESYAAGDAPGGRWTTRETNGTVTIDTAQKVSGNQSVKFTVTGSNSSRTAFIRTTDAELFPVADNHLFGRMMYWLESAPTRPVHWTMLEGGGTVPGQTYHALYRYGGQHPLNQGQTFVGSRLMANYDTPDWYGNMNTPGSDCWRHAQDQVLPTGQWVCVEWEFDGPNNTERLWLDGEAITAVTVTGSADQCLNAANDYVWEAPTFTQIDIGWESYQTDDPRTAYADDVVISTTRIGCP